MHKIVNTQPKNILNIEFWPTDICNFTCDYCFPGAVTGNYRYHENLDQVLQGFSNIFSFYNQQFAKEKFVLHVAGGGEPTLWPHIIEFCKGIKNLATVDIQLTSNGSRTEKYWQRIAPFLDSVALSCHHKEVDIVHLSEIADYLYSKGVDVTVQVLMDPNYWEKCIKYIDILQQSKYSWFIIAKQVTGYGSYTKEQLEFIRPIYKRLDTSDKIIKKIEQYNLIKSVEIINDEVFLSKDNIFVLENRNNFYAWNCNIGFERIVIDSAGNIKGACGMQILDGLNLFLDTLKNDLQNIKTIECKLQKCNCVLDTHVTKWKI